MAPHIETPAPPPGPLICGSFRQPPRFNTFRARGTEDWLLVHNLSGQARFGHAGGDLLTGPGDMILIKPRTPHDYGTAPGSSHWEPLWAHFIPKPDWLDWLEWPVAAPGIFLLRIATHEELPRILESFRSMLEYAASPLRHREALAMNALEEMLLRCDLANPRHEGTGTDPRVRRALAHIDTHFSEPLTVASLARLVSLSPSRFARLFRAQTGETPQRFVELQRLRRARQLLEFTQEPIRAIAGQVGFENPFYFTLRFKRHCGASPREWRRRSIRLT